MRERGNWNWLSRILMDFAFGTNFMFVLLATIPIYGFFKNPGLMSLLESAMWSAVGALCFGLVVAITRPGGKSGDDGEENGGGA